jgi:hypothetical protein
MNRSFLGLAVIAIMTMLLGCHNPVVRTSIDSSLIPDQTYEVTVYNRFMSISYAVLFDIPDDGVEVAMRHTAFTERIGKASPGKYIDEFNRRIKFYRTIQIGDQDGTVRGYLLVSGALDYWIAPSGERIIVAVEYRSESR